MIPEVIILQSFRHWIFRLYNWSTDAFRIIFVESPTCNRLWAPLPPHIASSAISPHHSLLSVSCLSASKKNVLSLADSLEKGTLLQAVPEHQSSGQIQPPLVTRAGRSCSVHKLPDWPAWPRSVPLPVLSPRQAWAPGPISCGVRPKSNAKIGWPTPQVFPRFFSGFNTEILTFQEHSQVWVNRGV